MFDPLRECVCGEFILPLDRHYGYFLFTIAGSFYNVPKIQKRFPANNFFLHFSEKYNILYRHHAGVMELVDVVDSKCASSFIVPVEKVVAIQALFMYNGISKFNIPPAHPS